MPKRRTTWLYWKRGRAYGDFRDLGGRKEALKAPNEKLATTDPDVANKLVADRVARLTEKRRNLGLGIKEERKPAPTLGLYASRHLVLKKKDKECSNTWLAESERHLKLACQYFGEGRALDSIDPEALTAWVNHLRKQPSRRGGKLTDSTIRKMLNTLSNLYARAVSEQKATGVVSNPVAAMFSKPTPQPTEAAYLAPAEARFSWKRPGRTGPMPNRALSLRCTPSSALSC